LARTLTSAPGIERRRCAMSGVVSSMSPSLSRLTINIRILALPVSSRSLMSPLSLAAWTVAFFLSSVLFSHMVALRVSLLLACAAALVCAVALYYFPRGPETYGVGWHGGPGDHSSALLTLMPCVLMAGWYAGRASWSRELRLLTACLGVLVLASAYTTLNRTIWLGFAAQLLILGAALVARRSASVDARTKALGAAVALAVIAGGVVMTLQVQAEREATGTARSLE